MIERRARYHHRWRGETQLSLGNSGRAGREGKVQQEKGAARRRSRTSYPAPFVNLYFNTPASLRSGSSTPTCDQPQTLRSHVQIHAELGQARYAQPVAKRNPAALCTIAQTAEVVRDRVCAKCRLSTRQYGNRLVGANEARGQ